MIDIIFLTAYGIIFTGLLIYGYFMFFKKSPTANATEYLLAANIAYENKDLEALKLLQVEFDKPDRSREEQLTWDFINIYITTLTRKGLNTKRALMKADEAKHN